MLVIFFFNNNIKFLKLTRNRIELVILNYNTLRFNQIRNQWSPFAIKTQMSRPVKPHLF